MSAYENHVQTARHQRLNAIGGLTIRPKTTFVYDANNEPICLVPITDRDFVHRVDGLPRYDFNNPPASGPRRADDPLPSSATSHWSPELLITYEGGDLIPGDYVVLKDGHDSRATKGSIGIVSRIYDDGNVEIMPDNGIDHDRSLAFGPASHGGRPLLPSWSFDHASVKGASWDGA